MAIEVGKTGWAGEVEGGDPIRYYRRRPRTASSDLRWTTSATRRSTPADPPAAWRVAVISPFNFDGAGRQPVGGMMAGQHGHLLPASRAMADRDPRGLPRRRRAGQGVQPRDGPGDTVGDGAGVIRHRQDRSRLVRRRSSSSAGSRPGSQPTIVGWAAERSSSARRTSRRQPRDRTAPSASAVSAPRTARSAWSRGSTS